MFKKLHPIFMLLLFSVGIYLLLFFWIFRAQPQQQLDLFSGYTSLRTGWNQVVGRTSYPLDDLNQITPSNTDVLVLETTLPTIRHDEYLLFFTKNQQVTLLIDNQILYNFSIQPDFAFFQTPGSTWHTIPLSPDMSGQSLRLILDSNVTRYYQAPNAIYLANASQILMVRFTHDGVFFFSSFLLLFFGIAAAVSTFFWRRGKLHCFIAHLSAIYFCCGLWILSNLDFFSLFFQRPLLSHLLSMLLIRLLPLLFLSLFRTLLTKDYPSLRLFIVLFSLHIPLSLLLHFSFNLSLLETLPLTHVLVFFSFFVCLVILFDVLTTLIDTLYEDILLLLHIIPLFCGFLDLILYYFADISHLTGLFTLSGFLIYAILSHILTLYQQSADDVDKSALEFNYQRLQMAGLMHQIKAHFIFNTLNAISALCKRDARQADHATKLFARYLRSYMYLITQEENISFQSEMELVHAYLDIEKLRFEDTLILDIQPDFVNFKIPPLSVQPLVENAVVHGLRQITHVGTISLRSTYENGFVYVVIIDDGAGFHVDDLTKTTSIGLNNIKKRVSHMSKGDVTILSQPGKGTKVTLRIPLEEKRG